MGFGRASTFRVDLQAINQTLNSKNNKDLFILKERKFMKVNQQDVLIIKIQNLFIGIALFAHTHGPFLTHAQTMTIPFSSKNNAIVTEGPDTEKSRF
jgi:hypothetical protein